MAKAPDIEKYKRAVGMLALANTVPFVGPLTIDSKVKEFLFCAGEVADKCTPPDCSRSYRDTIGTVENKRNCLATHATLKSRLRGG
jgi:hypothetical protein